MWGFPELLFDGNIKPPFTLFHSAMLTVMMKLSNRKPNDKEENPKDLCFFFYFPMTHFKTCLCMIENRLKIDIISKTKAVCESSGIHLKSLFFYLQWAIKLIWNIWYPTRECWDKGRDSEWNSGLGVVFS